MTQVAADLQSDNPSPSKVNCMRKFVFFVKRLKTFKEQKLEALIQCVDLHADSIIKRAAVSKNDGSIMTIVSREVIAAEACYHKSCYHDDTKNVQGGVNAKSQAYLPKPKQACFKTRGLLE